MPGLSKNFIEEFKQGQESVLVTLEQIAQHARSFGKARPQLPELENKLLLHLQYQQNKIYPALADFFSENREAAKKMEFLRYEINELKVKTAIFTDKYSFNFSAVTARNFPIAFMEFRQAVIERIRSEGEQLLPLLDEFMSAKDL